MGRTTISTLRPASLALIAAGVLIVVLVVSAPFLIPIVERDAPDIVRERDDGPAGTILPGVFTYQQQRSLSCEYASLAIATTLLGRPVSEHDFVALVPSSENPHWGYRGNIDGEWGNTTDYGVYAGPLVPALAAVGFTGEAFYGEAGDLRRELDLGRPVVVWLGMWGDGGSFDAWTADGARFQLTTGMHVMVAYGYDEERVYITDPGTAVLREYDWTTFATMWAVMDGMALSVRLD